VRIECPSCGGTGCNECADLGKIRLVGCPHQTVDRELWDAVELVGFAEKGHLPVSGGMLEQTRFFADALRFLSSEHARLEAETIKNAGHKA